MSSEKLDFENFVIHFNSSLTNKTVGDLFRKYLKSEFNSEPWDFLMKIKEMKNLTEVNEKIELIKNILKTYIHSDSQSEINISGKMKSELLSTFELQMNSKEWKLKMEPNDYFNKAEKIIREELYHDSWKRFVRSNYSQEIINKFYTDPTVCSPQITEQFDYTMDYFKHSFIEDDDFRFSKLLFQDNFHWEVFFQFLKEKVDWIKK
jgi:hypothetical protein